MEKFFVGKKSFVGSATVVDPIKLILNFPIFALQLGSGMHSIRPRANCGPRKLSIWPEKPKLTYVFVLIFDEHNIIKIKN